MDAGIKVMHVVDSAMRWAVNHFEVDLIIIGADSITSEGTVLNKIGSRLPMLSWIQFGVVTVSMRMVNLRKLHHMVIT